MADTEMKDSMGELATEKALPKFVLFGASLTEWSFSEETEGFGWFLQKTYKGKAEVVNKGQAGYTSSRILPDFDRIIERATAPEASPTLLFTIFLGANDACFVGDREFVPWPEFEANIRKFIETILTQDAMQETKIVLITPPPIAIGPPRLPKVLTHEEAEGARGTAMKGIAYRTYISKKRYADGVMRIASDYAETGRVVGINFWRGLVDAILVEAGQPYDETMPPGSGLLGTLEIGHGWFTDGLHLDRKGYNVLSKQLFETVTRKWPELAPENM